MVSTREGFTDNSTILHIQYKSTKKPGEIKSLRQFLEALDVKHKTSICRLGASKAKRREIIPGNKLWSII